MKIGMLIPEFPTQTHSFFWREIEAIRDQSIEVAILSTKRPTDSCPHEFSIKAIKQTHYIYPPNKLSIAKLIFDLKKTLKAFRYINTISGGWRRKTTLLGYYLCAIDLLIYSRYEKIDHIHVHSCADAAHIVAITNAMGGPTYSLHLHGDLPVYGTDHLQKSKNALFVAAAASPMQKQLIREVNLSEEKTCTLWMGVDFNRFQISREYLIKDQVFHIVSISRLHINKGHVFTLRAIQKLKQEGISVKYTIAGSGPHEETLKQDILDLSLESCVHMVGSLSEAEILDLLSLADVFVLSSIGVGEASPVAVMEAMSSGLPVVCSIIGGTPDMINNNVDGILTEQENFKQIHAALSRIYLDANFRKQLGENAKKKAADQFDCKNTAKKLLNTIKQHRDTEDYINN